MTNKETYNTYKNEELREEIAKNNFALVHMIARRYKNKDEYEDLFQVGCIGLVKAMNSFDESKGYEFTTYAVPKIEGEIKAYIRDNKPIHITRSIKEKINKMYYTYGKFIRENGRQPRDEEISELAGMSLKELKEIMKIANDCSLKYLDNIIYSDNGNASITLGEAIPCGANMEEDITNKIFIDDVLNDLEGREQKVIRMRYFEDMTQMEAAKELGISQVQVSRIEKRALSKMKMYYMRSGHNE